MHAVYVEMVIAWVVVHEEPPPCRGLVRASHRHGEQYALARDRGEGLPGRRSAFELSSDRGVRTSTHQPTEICERLSTHVSHLLVDKNWALAAQGGHTGISIQQQEQGKRHVIAKRPVR